MSNIIPRYPVFNRHLIRNAAPDWLKGLIGEDEVTDFLTIRLANPLKSDPADFNKLARPKLSEARKRVARAIDRAIYPNDNIVPAEERFRYIFLMESHGQHGRDTWLHIHIALALTEDQVKKYRKKICKPEPGQSEGYGSLQKRLMKSLMRLGFEPDILTKTANDDVLSYMSKNVEKSGTEIYTRAMMAA